MPSKRKTTAAKEEAKPALVPKLRFPEFRGAALRIVQLGDVTEEGRSRNGKKHSVASVMGVTKADGIVPMESRLIAQDIARYLQVPLGRAHVGRFSDGEVTVEIMENVRGRDVFIVQPTCPPVNDNLMELLIMADACRRASARSVFREQRPWTSRIAFLRQLRGAAQPAVRLTARKLLLSDNSCSRQP